MSLIEAGAIETCGQRLGMPVDAALLRRNLVIAGLDLRALLHAELIIGDVRLEIVSTCPPCSYLARKAGIDAKAGLKYIGGVRAKVLGAGMLHVGAAITVA